MRTWWWLVLIIQVTSCKVLAQGESTTVRGESDCQDPDCKGGPLWTQEPGTNVVKRQPLLSRWGSQRLSDLFYLDYKRRPAFSSWGGKRGPAFSSWGGKRSVRNTQANDSNAWTQPSSPDDLTLIPYHTIETRENLEPINDDWNDIEARKLHLYSFPAKNPLVPFPSSWVSRGESLFDSVVPRKESYLEYIPFKENMHDPQSDTRYEMDNFYQEGDTLSNSDGKRAAAFNSWGGKRAPAFNSWGGKRAAAFNSWGGKRALGLDDLDEDKRAAAFNSWGGKRAAAFNSWGGKRAAAFNSWGGKRAPELYNLEKEKRAAFNSWGGKRAAELNNLDENKRAAAFNSWGGKRATAFNSWGGKRSQELYDLDEQKRAAPFNSWGGKRAAAFNSWGGKRAPELYDLDEEKRAAAFNSWGGKRAAELNNLDENKRAAAFNSWGGKRAAAFNSWGGKRALGLDDLDEDKRAAAFNRWGGKRAAAFNSWGGKRAAAFNSWGGKRVPELDELGEDKRAAAFNSWGGKRVPELNDLGEYKRAAAFNSWGGKRAAAFNSWGGKRVPELNDLDEDKRSAAFNSWGGKRAAAFNSWGGKRAQELYDLDEDKRAAAFNSWGGKRAAAFNSWGGKRVPEIFNFGDNKRAPAFNSWGGKRTNTAFSSWGGKRAAAFNSWGGKRTPAFNSWGGKRSGLIAEKGLEPQNSENKDKDSNTYGNYTQQSALEIDTTDPATKLPQESSRFETILSTYDDGIQRSDGRNDNDDGDNKDDSSIREKRKRLTIIAGKRKPRFYSWGGKKRSESETDEYNLDDNTSNMLPDEDYGDEPLETIQDKNEIENDSSMMGKFMLHDKSIKKRTDELYTTHSRSGFSGKRKPAFSSWGGKRSEPDGNNNEDKIENDSRRKRSIMDEDLSNGVWGGDSNDSIDNSLFPTNTLTCCVKKLQYGDKNLFMQMLFRNNGFRDLSWPSIRPNRRGAEFYAWGGKRSTL